MVVLSSIGDAAINTVICLIVVFSVLTLFVWVIGLFKYVSKFEAYLAKKKEAKTDIAAAAVTNTVSQIEAKEEVVEEDLTDDLELVAVITAAIAASMGTASTDGFVVRSIKRNKNNKWAKA